MKTKEELNILREEVETLNKKLAKLTEEELKQVTGGIVYKESHNRNFVLACLEPDLTWGLFYDDNENNRNM